MNIANVYYPKYFYKFREFIKLGNIITATVAELEIQAPPTAEFFQVHSIST